MKYCPVCLFSYPEEATSCPNDGARLTASFEWLAGMVIRNKYRILSKLGGGGAGTVYKAEHVALEELRALKVLNPQFGQDPQFVKRFRQEAKTTRRLHHPNIVRVEDLDQAEDGSLFISMEYIDGVTLRRLLHVPDAPLPVARVLNIGRIVAEALHAAHEQGVVHRDIKPENILLGTDRDGREVPKVVDFGLVALKEGSGTRSVEMMLTPAYAAPEQWRRVKARELDGRTDIYALGVTLYEMLVGHRPFKGETFEEWMHAHLMEAPPPPSVANPRLAEVAGLDTLVLEMMAKDREARPPSAAVVVDRLGLVIADLAGASWSQGTVITPPGTTLRQAFVAPFAAQQQSGLAPATPAEQRVLSAPPDASRANEHQTGPRLKPFAARPAVVAVLAVLALAGAFYLGLGVQQWLRNRDGARPLGMQPGPAAPGAGQTQAASPGTPETQAADSPKAPTSTVNTREAEPGEPGASRGAVAGLDAETVSKINRELGKASKAHDLGNYDAAIAAYQEVLKLDEGSKRARDGAEKAQSAKIAEGSIRTSDPAPLTVQLLTTLVTQGVGTTRLQQIVSSCGLAFEVTEEIAKRLRAAGATPAFVALLRPPGSARVGDRWESPTDGQTMTWIPPGSFQMGSPSDEPGRKDDEPAHPVSIARGFWIGQTEVTNAAYRRFVRANPDWQKGEVRAGYRDGNYLADWQSTRYPDGFDAYPVVRVSWYAARAYCGWIGGRLPSEAEWEYSARAGTTTMFWWGAALDDERVNITRIAAVGDGRRKNPWGLVDILGNAWEWTSSLARPYPYRAEDGREDPLAEGLRIARGGGLSSGVRFVRAANRTAAAREQCNDVIGFRCVR